MDCASCPSRSSCGDPGYASGVPDPRLSGKQLVSLACTIARVASVVCDVGGVKASRELSPEEQPYIWDLEEN